MVFKRKSVTGRSDSRSLKIIPLGGLDFIGSNCTLFEYKDNIVMVDAGIGFPLTDHFGVDCLIPNPKYLLKNKSKIKGLVITHGHLDHIGAIPYLIENLGFPTIYASDFAAELILANLKNYFRDLYPKVKIQRIHKDSELKLGGMDISFFGVNHSIPEAMGVIVRTGVGNIVHTGDFKFDNSPINSQMAEYDKIARVGSEGVLCLLSDSTNSFESGFSISESEIVQTLEHVIEDVKGRVIIATFSSMVNRIIELLDIAEKLGKKVFVSGRSMQVAIEIANKVKYAKFNKDIFIKGNQLNKYPDNKIMVLATGAQGEALAALGRMARNEHREIKVKKNDTVILSASIIPGNGAVVQNLIDELSKLGANVYHNKIMDLHATGHGNKEDQKLMINLVKPKFFMPVHGFQAFLYHHAKTAMEVGIKEENTIIAKSGDVVELTQHKWKKSGKVEAVPVIVSGSVVGDVGNAVLDDRQQLASFGVFVFSIIIDSKTSKLVKDPWVVSRGFVYVRQSQDMIKESIDLIRDSYENKCQNVRDAAEVRSVISRDLKKYLYGQTEREPMILSVINYI